MGVDVGKKPLFREGGARLVKDGKSGKLSSPMIITSFLGRTRSHTPPQTACEVLLVNVHLQVQVVVVEGLGLESIRVWKVSLRCRRHYFPSGQLCYVPSSLNGGSG